MGPCACAGPYDWCLSEFPVLLPKRTNWLYCCILWYVGEHHKQTPVLSALPQQVSEMLVRCISINSAYTSRVLVTSHSVFLNIFSRLYRYLSNFNKVLRVSVAVSSQRLCWGRVCPANMAVKDYYHSVYHSLATHSFITVCTVVQHCCKGRSKKYMKWPFSGRCRRETP